MSEKYYWSDELCKLNIDLKTDDLPNIILLSISRFMEMFNKTIYDVKLLLDDKVIDYFNKDILIVDFNKIKKFAEKCKNRKA